MSREGVISCSTANGNAAHLQTGPLHRGTLSQPSAHPSAHIFSHPRLMTSRGRNPTCT